MSLKWKVPDKLRRALKFNIHRHKTNTNIQSNQGPQLLSLACLLVKDFTHRMLELKAFEITYQFFILFPPNQGEPLFSVPKSNFKALNLERISKVAMGRDGRDKSG